MSKSKNEASYSNTNENSSYYLRENIENEETRDTSIMNSNLIEESEVNSKLEEKNKKTKKEIITVSTEEQEDYYLKLNEKTINKSQNVIRKLCFICVFCCVFMVIELIGGYIAGSLALLTDVAHLLCDLLGFLISMASMWLSMKPANKQYTFGYHRYEVLGALTSIFTIWVMTGLLITEAVERFYHPKDIKSNIMIEVAGCGLVFNLIMAKILLMNDDVNNAFEHSHDHGHCKSNEDNENGNNKYLQKLNKKESSTDLKTDNTEEEKESLISIIDDNFENKNNKNNLKNCNESNPENNEKHDNSLILKATLIHILGDLIQSIGVLIAACSIHFFKEKYPWIIKVDPFCTFIFGIIVISTTLPVCKECFKILLETSCEINADSVVEQLKKENEEIINIHDVHIWNLSIGKSALTAHIVVKDISNNSHVITKAGQSCLDLGILHTTFQIETLNNNIMMNGEKTYCPHFYNNGLH